MTAMEQGFYFRWSGHSSTLRRQLIYRDRSPKSLLGLGERKSFQTDRVILVPPTVGDIEEIAKHLFRKAGCSPTCLDFHLSMSDSAIMRQLNNRYERCGR